MGLGWDKAAALQFYALSLVRAGQRRGGGCSGDLRDEAPSPVRATSDSPAMPHNSIRSGKNTAWPGPRAPKMRLCVRSASRGQETSVEDSRNAPLPSVGTQLGARSSFEDPWLGALRLPRALISEDCTSGEEPQRGS